MFKMLALEAQVNSYAVMQMAQTLECSSEAGFIIAVSKGEMKGISRFERLFVWDKRRRNAVELCDGDAKRGFLNV